MADTWQEGWLVRAMRDGGYLVLSAPLADEVFAATTIDEALGYIKYKIENGVSPPGASAEGNPDD